MVIKMKKILALLLIMLLGTFTVFADPAPLFYDDFESGSGQWATNDGSSVWPIVTSGSSKVIKSSKSSSSIISAGDKISQTVSFSADLKIIEKNTAENSSISLFLQYDSATNNFSIRYIRKDGGWKYQILRNNNNVISECSAPDLQLNTVYKFKIIRYNNTAGNLEFWVDDTFVLAGAYATAKTGKYAISTTDMSVEFDNTTALPVTGEPSPPPAPPMDPPAPVEDVLFEDDFESGIGNWSPYSTSTAWTNAVSDTGNKVIRSTDTGSNTYSAGKSSWSNYYFEIDVQPVYKSASESETASFGICFGYAQYSNHYGARYIESNGTYKYDIFKTVGGTTTSLVSIATTQLSDERIYRFKAIMNKGILEFWVDGEKLLEFSDTTFTTGKIALETTKFSVDFDNAFVAPCGINLKLDKASDLSAYPNTPIKIIFDDEMDAATLNNQNVTVKQGNTQIGADKISITPIDSQNREFILTINDWLLYDTAYTVNFSDGVQGKNGGDLTYYLKTLTFTTKKQPTAVEITSCVFKQKVGSSYVTITEKSQISGTVRVSITAKSTTANTVNLTVLSAVCNGDNTSYSTEQFTKRTETISGDGSDHSMVYELNIPQGLKSPMIKLFFTNNLSSPIKLAETKTLIK